MIITRITGRDLVRAIGLIIGLVIINELTSGFSAPVRAALMILYFIIFAVLTRSRDEDDMPPAAPDPKHQAQRQQKGFDPDSV